MNSLENMSSRELINLQTEANNGGDYELARQVIDRELLRRSLAIQALSVVNTPAWDMLEGTN